MTWSNDENDKWDDEKIAQVEDFDLRFRTENHEQMSVSNESACA